MIAVRVTPRSGRDGIAGHCDEILLVKLAAAPIEGAANDALIELFAAVLDIPSRSVSLVSGGRRRHKRVAVRGYRACDLNERLTRVLNSAGGAARL